MTMDQERNIMNNNVDQKQWIPLYESLPHEVLDHIYFHTANHVCVTVGLLSCLQITKSSVITIVNLYNGKALIFMLS